MTSLVVIVSITEVAARPPRLTPTYQLQLACGHRVTRRLGDGPIPKRAVHCHECVDDNQRKRLSQQTLGLDVLDPAPIQTDGGPE